MDELVATAEAFCAADFDGNGEADTVGMAIAKDLWGQLFSMRGFFNAFDAYPASGWRMKTASWCTVLFCPAPATPWKPCTKCMRRA